MGADGHITIWKRDDALVQFPEADKLFELLPNCYREEFAGIELYHAYHGDNMYDDWMDSGDWLFAGDGYPPVERQKEFSAWLRANCAAQWEVWT